MRSSSLGVVLAVCGAVLLGGCAKPLRLKDAQSIVVGQTTDANVKQLFGKPNRTADKRDSTTRSQQQAWSRIQPGSFLLAKWVDMTMVGVETREGNVNGWYYASNKKSDRTIVDLELREKITVGGAKRSDVIALLGQPHGEMNHDSHLADDPNIQLQLKGNDVTYKRAMMWFNAPAMEYVIMPPSSYTLGVLLVLLDENDVVKNVVVHSFTNNIR